MIPHGGLHGYTVVRHPSSFVPHESTKRMGMGCKELRVRELEGGGTPIPLLSLHFTLHKDSNQV